MDTQADTARYSLVIQWSDEDCLYIATCPELSGCRTHGATRVEALVNGEEAIADWLFIAPNAGWNVPAPHIFGGDRALAVSVS